MAELARENISVKKMLRGGSQTHSNKNKLRQKQNMWPSEGNGSPAAKANLWGQKCQLLYT